jgi:hypothetical protein
MGWWGIAIANGHHINRPTVDEERATSSWEARTKARTLAAGAGTVERALIDAAARRYADPQPADRTPLDRAYADAMRAALEAYPDDPDVGAQYAEALMDLRPWDRWAPDGPPRRSWRPWRPS